MKLIKIKCGDVMKLGETKTFPSGATLTLTKEAQKSGTNKAAAEMEKRIQATKQNADFLISEFGGGTIKYAFMKGKNSPARWYSKKEYDQLIKSGKKILTDF